MYVDVVLQFRHVKSFDLFRFQGLATAPLPAARTARWPKQTVDVLQILKERKSGLCFWFSDQWDESETLYLFNDVS